jgi:hypothetical protein
MENERWVQGAMAVMAVAVTAWFLLAAQPEEAFVQSVDKVVTVVGAGAQANNWRIERIGTPLGAPLTGYAYELFPSGRQPVNVTLGIVADQAQALYRLNTELNAWEVVPEGQEIPAGVTATIQDFATYAVGAPLAVTPPTFVSDQEALFAERPENAIGYDSFTAVAEPGGPSIIIPENTHRALCDGLARNYHSVAYSRRTRMVEGKRYDLILRWLIADEKCESGVLK